MLPGNSRWMVTLMECDLPICILGSMEKLSASPPMAGVIGTVGGARVGSGTVEPSTPTRNALVSLEAPAQDRSVRGPLQVMVCEKPTPRMGSMTTPAPLVRSKVMPQPPRSTVFLAPNSAPISPEEKFGFQAAAMRGPKLLLSMS